MFVAKHITLRLIVENVNLHEYARRFTYVRHQRPAKYQNFCSPRAVPIF